MFLNGKNSFHQDWNFDMESKFDIDLFYSICEEYGVEFSDEYNEPLVKLEDGSIVTFTSFFGLDVDTEKKKKVRLDF